MHRLYINQAIGNNSITITDAEQLHYLRDVLRLKVHDEVVIFDNQENEYTCSITELSKNQATLTVKSRKRAEPQHAQIAVACAIPKNDRMDEIVDSLTQLGVATIIPMETERVIVRLDEKRKEARLNRWRKIAQSAAQQSQRNSIPLVESVTSFASVLSHSQDYDLKLIPTLSGDRRHIREVLTDSARNILVLIGPEGDFTPQETKLAREAGFIPVSLGDSVLRVSTAAIAVMSYISLSSSPRPA